MRMTTAVVVALLTTVWVDAQALQGRSGEHRYTAPRTPWGDPDLQGIPTRPWSFGMQLTRDPQSQVFEYACHEGNEGLRNMLRVAREVEKRQEP